MKIRFLVIFFVIISFNSFSQLALEFSATPKTDKRIIIVPFDQRIYFNDATEIIAKKDDLSHEQIMEYFRFEINNQLAKALSDSCYVTNMLANPTTTETKEEIENIFSIVSYEMAIVRPNEYVTENEKKHLFKKKKTEEKNCETGKISKTKIENGEIVTNRTTLDDKYLKIIFSDKKILEKIAAKYKADYFLFINQFEIKGDGYRDPYISGNKNAKRVIKIHFQIFDYSGHLVHGGFAENKIPFILDDKQEIINSYFPEIVRQIISNIK